MHARGAQLRLSEHLPRGQNSSWLIMASEMCNGQHRFDEEKQAEQVQVTENASMETEHKLSAQAAGGRVYSNKASKGEEVP